MPAISSAIALFAESEFEILAAISATASPSTAEAEASDEGGKLEPIAAPPKALATDMAATMLVSSHPPSKGGKRAVALLYAKKLGKELELSVDLRTVVGTGPLGRTVAKDVDAAAAAAARMVVKEKAATSAASPMTGGIGDY
ncbi:hypothetical protein Ancab_039010 [Ancistrocladus abbreviatus]